MAESGRIAGDRVMCHSCQNQWQRSQGGLVCPHCESDFTEIIENDPSPESYPSSTLTPSRPLAPLQPPHPFHSYDPWPIAPDPEEDDISTFQFNTSAGGRGTISFSSRTYTTRGNGRNVFHGLNSYPEPDPDMADLAMNLAQLLTNVASPQNSRRGLPNDPVMTSLFPFGGLGTPRQNTGFSAFTAGSMHPMDPPNVQTGNFQDIFSLVFQHLNANHPQMNDPNQTSPFALLSSLFNPANARHGDAVFSQEAFDRVMSQLMEQNSGSTAPGPASEAAIDSLPTKLVEKEMMGNDGKAECSICMDNVVIGDEVTVLPCNHWFHGQCVTAWLKEHDTCPHCRKSIASPEDANQHGRANPRRRSSRRSSSIGSPRSPVMEGNRSNTFTIPESPSQLRETRQQYYGIRPAEDYERPRSHRHSSQGSERPPNNRHGSRSGGSNGSGGGGGGGVGGWIRNHLPF